MKIEVVQYPEFVISQRFSNLSVCQNHLEDSLKHCWTSLSVSDAKKFPGRQTTGLAV